MSIYPDACRLYTVMRTDLRTYERTLLTYPPSDYLTAVKLADFYQRSFGADVYDYRVCSCS